MDPCRGPPVRGSSARSTSLAPFPGTETPIYIALTAFLLNVVVVVVLTPILRALDVPDGEDATEASDYSVDAGAEGVVEELSSTTEVR